MNDIDFLADQLRRAHVGQAWHGPSLRETLSGVTAEMASARPIAGAHTIWELVLHVSAWLTAVGRRLAGESVELAGAEDWPVVEDASDAAWQKTLATLDRETNALEEAIARLPEGSLRKGVAGCNYSVRFMLEGVVQHHLYHAGQIALLKKIAAPR